MNDEIQNLELKQDNSLISEEQINRLKKSLEENEGRRPFPYDDKTGKNWKDLNPGMNITIAVGRNLIDNPLSDSEIDLLRDNSIKGAIQDARKLKIFSFLSSNRQNVVIEMIYTMGLPRFNGFKKMIAALESRDYSKAADEMLDSEWASQVKKRAIKLSNSMRWDV